MSNLATALKSEIVQAASADGLEGSDAGRATSQVVSAQTLSGVLAAVHERARTGKGRRGTSDITQGQLEYTGSFDAWGKKHDLIAGVDLLVVFDADLGSGGYDVLALLTLLVEDDNLSVHDLD